MRWFKHFSDNHRGRTVQKLMDEMGHSGVVAYYFIMEMCAEKLERSDRALTENDCILFFNRKVIDNVARMKRKSIDNVGIIGTECGVWEWKENGNEIEIKMPILLDLLDRDLKGKRSRRAQDAEKPRLELELELDIEKKKTKSDAKSIALRGKSAKAPAKSSALFEVYRDSYLVRYRVEPTRDKIVNAQLCKMIDRVGEEDAIAIVKFYLTHNDSLYIKATHSIDCCLSHITSLRTQMLRGKAITGTKAKEFEKKSENLDQAEMFRRLSEQPGNS